MPLMLIGRSRDTEGKKPGFLQIIMLFKLNTLKEKSGCFNTVSVLTFSSFCRTK